MSNTSLLSFRYIRAAKEGDLDRIRRFLQHTSDRDAIEWTDNDGRTLLHHASRHGAVRVLEYLLEQGASINVQDRSFGSTPLHQATVSPRHRLAVIPFLLDQGAERECKNTNGKTPLCWACSKGYLDAVELLLERGAELHSRDNVGRTPLWWACCHGQIKVVRLLLERGAFVDAGDHDDKTPLSSAVENGKMDCVQLLLDRGASVHLSTMETTDSPLIWAIRNRRLDPLYLMVRCRPELWNWIADLMKDA